MAITERERELMIEAYSDGLRKGVETGVLGCIKDGAESLDSEITRDAAISWVDEWLGGGTLGDLIGAMVEGREK